MTSSANDILFGNQMTNQLSGWDGNDYLSGLDGNDTLHGGRGEDYLGGDAGNDIYYWGQGDGNDSIAESAGQDKVVLTNLNRVDVDIVSNSNGGLLIQNHLSTESLLVGGIADESTWIEQIVFADGSTLDLPNYIRQMYNNQNPSSNVTLTLGADQNNLTLTGSDNIDGTGNALNNTLTGNSGNNRLYGLDGMDTLVGGDGNDTLSGGSGHGQLVPGQPVPRGAVQDQQRQDAAGQPGAKPGECHGSVFAAGCRTDHPARSLRLGIEPGTCGQLAISPPHDHARLGAFHITRDIKNTQAALQMLLPSLCGAFLASIWPQIRHQISL